MYKMKRPVLKKHEIKPIIDFREEFIELAEYADKLEKYIDFLEVNFKPKDYVRSDKFGNVYEEKGIIACARCVNSPFSKRDNNQCEWCNLNNSKFEYYK